MHGPKPRSHAFKLNKKVRRLGLMIALSARAAEGKARLFFIAIISFGLYWHKLKMWDGLFSTMPRLTHILTREVFFPYSSETSLWKFCDSQLLVFDNLEVPTHKTKYIVNYVNEMEEAKKLLLVDGGPIDEKLKLATQNLHYVNVLPSIVSLLDNFLFFVV